MIKSFSILILLAAFNASAGLVSSNLLTYASFSASTNDSSSVLLGNVYTPAVTYAVQHGALTDTNAITINFRYGFGSGTNCMTNSFTWNPTTTNATIESVTLPNNGVLSVYVNPLVTVTNALSVGIQSIQNK